MKGNIKNLTLPHQKLKNKPYRHDNVVNMNDSFCPEDVIIPSSTNDGVDGV